MPTDAPDDDIAYQARLEALLLRQRDRHRQALAVEAEERDRLRTALCEAQDRAARLSEEVARAQEELQAVHRSSSWRLTAPLRWLRRRSGTA